MIMRNQMGKKQKYLSAFIGLSLLLGTLPAYASDLPSYFDWRLTTPTDRTSAATSAIVGAVRNQNPFNNCWCFATMASLESTLNLKLQAAGLNPIQPLSERYLSWLTTEKPLNGGGDGFVFYHTGAPYQNGGETYTPISVLLRYGVAYNNSEWPFTDNHEEGSTMDGVSLVSGRGAALHDVYGLIPDYDAKVKLKDNIAYYKELIKEKGLLFIGYYAGASTELGERSGIAPNIYHLSGTADHAVSLVGWDDSYTMTDTSGKVHTGAWLLRNSWGENYKGYRIGKKGYFYLSYDDATAMMGGVFEAETDWGRYTTVNTVAQAGMDGYAEGASALFKPVTSYKTADKLTSGASQMLKAVGIYVPADDMSYKVEVSLKGDTPAAATPIYTQSGTFGQDGTARYKGYRTVDLSKYVYLPKAQNYTITVTLTGQDGVTYNVPLAGAEPEDTITTVASGVSFLYDAASGTWVDTKNEAGKNGYTNLAIPLYALNKYSKEANGGDFTVVSLNDNGTGGSEIYLGRKDELYTTDLLHPVTTADGTTIATGVPRYTLSHMTVELTKGLTDSVYGGVISGEGSVTKTGDGLLALSGANTYTGETSVKEGSLALTGSLQSPVTVASGATFTGYGTINGNLTNSGTLVPGLTTEAQNLFTTAAGGTGTAATPQVGTLTVNGNFISNGKLVVATSGTNISQLAVRGSSTLTGTALSVVDGGSAPLINHKYNYLTSQGGITGNVTAGDVSPYVSLTAVTEDNNAYVTANQKQTLGGLSGMTPSEQSVGAALNQLTVQAAAASPDSSRTQALNAVLYQDEAASRSFTKQVTSEARAQLLNQSPMSSLTSETVYSRLEAVDYSGLVGAEVKLPQLAERKTAKANTAAAEYGDSLMRTTTPVALDASNNLWFKLFKGYETYNYADELKNHSFGGAVGYDHALNLTTRVGGLFSYGVTNYSTDNLSGDSHDWRVGAYVDHKNGNWDYQGLVTYGHNKYDLDRYVLGDKVNSDYKAKVWDVEAKAKYLIPSTRAKTWQFTPYGKLSYTHTNQDAYSETGSSVFAQNIESASYNSTRGEIGLEFKRAYDKHGGFGGSVGYKRVISGVNPELNGTFAGDNHNFTVRGDNDRNFVTYSLNVQGSLGGRWTGQAELRGEASQNTHKEIISVAAKYHF
jgi:autotransporter-associated beta strand protein